MPVLPLQAGEPLLVTIMSHREIVTRGTAALLSEHPDRILLVTLANMTTWRQRVSVAVYDLALVQEVGESHLSHVIERLGGRVVGLADDATTALASRALVLGVAGCLTLAAEPDAVLAAVSTAAAGDLLPGQPRADEVLTPQERAIATLISEGLSNKEISDRLFISANTLKSHIRTAYRKMGVQSRPQAVAWCARHGVARLDLSLDPRVGASRS